MKQKRMRYDEATKAAIHKATSEALKAGKPWAEAFEAAKAAGYKSALGSLVQFMKPAKKKAAKAKKVKTTVKTPAKAKRVAAAPAALVAPASLDITALVHQTVTNSVISALEGLLATLKGGTSSGG